MKRKQAASMTRFFFTGASSCLFECRSTSLFHCLTRAHGAINAGADSTAGGSIRRLLLFFQPAKGLGKDAQVGGDVLLGYPLFQARKPVHQFLESSGRRKAALVREALFVVLVLSIEYCAAN